MNERGQSAWDVLKQESEDGYDFEFEHVVQIPPVPLGIAALDEALGGGIPVGMYTVIGGEGGTGKSAMATVALYEAAKKSRMPIYFSLEMPRQMVVNRLLSVHARAFGLPPVYWSSTRSTVKGNIDAYNRGHPGDRPRRIRTQEDVDWYLATYSERDNVIRAWRDFRERAWSRMVVHDQLVSIDWICGVVRAMVSDGIHPMPIIDYVQLAPVASGMSEYDAVTSASRALQQLSKECRIPVLALSSLRNINKSERNDKPNQSMLRGSGNLGYDAGTVIILTKDGERVPEVRPNNRVVEVQPIVAHIVKNRVGSSNVEVSLTFDGGANEFR